MQSETAFKDRLLLRERNPLKDGKEYPHQRRVRFNLLLIMNQTAIEEGLWITERLTRVFIVLRDLTVINSSMDSLKMITGLSHKVVAYHRDLLIKLKMTSVQSFTNTTWRIYMASRPLCTCKEDRSWIIINKISGPNWHTIRVAFETFKVWELFLLWVLLTPIRMSIIQRDPCTWDYINDITRPLVNRHN